MSRAVTGTGVISQDNYFSRLSNKTIMLKGNAYSSYCIRNEMGSKLFYMVLVSITTTYSDQCKFGDAILK